MVSVGAIPHIFGIHADPALVQFIRRQTVDVIEILYSITYESSILILLIPILHRAIGGRHQLAHQD